MATSCHWYYDHYKTLNKKDVAHRDEPKENDYLTTAPPQLYTVFVSAHSFHFKVQTAPLYDTSSCHFLELS